MYNRVFATIAGFIAMAFVIASYFVKKKQYYLLCQLICIVFLVVSYFFTTQFFAMIGLSIGLFRTATFYIYEKKEKVAPIIWSFVFAGATVLSYFVVNLMILKTAQPLDILCMTGLSLYAFIFRIRNLKIVRYTMLCPTTLSVLFNVLTKTTIFATATYVFELCANIVSILKYHVFNKVETQKQIEDVSNNN